MPRTKLVNGIRRNFTPDEETARDAEEAQELADSPMELWKEKMARSDGPLPRWAEDLVDGTISSQTQKLSVDKKALRATRP